MNKKELIMQVSGKSGIMKKDAEALVNCVLESITETLSRKEKVQLTGFGTFEVRKRNARDCKNPQTGDMVHVTETTVPAFRPGTGLKEAVAKR